MKNTFSNKSPSENITNMKTTIEKIIDNIWTKVLGFFLLSLIPAFEFYVDLFKTILNKPTGNSLLFTGNIIDIMTGLLLGSMYLLFLQSKKEYFQTSHENKRIREMILTIHTLDNIRFQKIKTIVPRIFENEEQELRSQLHNVYKKDLQKDYQDVEIGEILDCFYRRKPKF